MSSTNGAKNRNDYLELLRFIASILIMCTHLFYIELPWGSYPYTMSWVYVEFFFILTGYFTTRHFAVRRLADAEAGTSGKNSLLKRFWGGIVYTVKKFTKFLPYTLVIVPIAYVVNWWKYLDGVKWSILDLVAKSEVTWPQVKTILGAIYEPFHYFIVEIFFLSEFVQYPIFSGTLWYLCAMFTVFPVFCFILQWKKDWMIFILSAVCGAAYYIVYGVSGLREFPHDLLRAFACLCLGTVVYYLSGWVGKINTKKNVDVVITVVEVAAFVATMVITGFNLMKLLPIVLILFIVIGTLMFSGKSYTQKIRCSYFQWLGKLSIPIFMWQWTWETFMNLTMKKYGLRRRTLIYFAGTLALSTVHMLVVEFIRSRRKK